MIVLDSHAFVWWVSESPILGRTARREIAASKRVGVSAITCFEIATAVKRGRIELDRPIEDWFGAAFELRRVELIPLTPEIAVAAAALGVDSPGDPADRIIVASAVLLAAPLVTRDKRIAASGAVTTIW